jgi:uncharacterized protein (TIGR03435 family)
MRRVIFAAIFPLWVMAQVAGPSTFEVASVKASYGRTIDGHSYSSIDTPSPGRLVAENSSLDELIRYAFQVKSYQLVGPNWLNDDSECFDIVAKAQLGTPEREIRAMMQTLLADRFKLAFHRETRQLPVLKLVVGKNGPRLQAAAADGERPGTSSAGGDVSAKHVFMSSFATWLSREMHRPVLDETGLKGRFDFTFKYATSGTDDGRPPLSSALQEQLGLRLEGGRGAIETLVIDHVEKVPTEN